MANWPQTVNVIGAIKTTRNHAVMDPVGHLLTLYRATVNGQVVPAVVSAPAPVDVVAALDRAAGVLSVGLINASPKEDLAMKLKISGVTGLQPATGWRIQGPELGSINVPGQPEAVTLTKLPGAVVPDKPVSLPATRSPCCRSPAVHSTRTLVSTARFHSSAVRAAGTNRYDTRMKQLAFELLFHLDKHLAQLTESYGTWTYVILFVVVFCETGLVVTPFLPGDSLLFAAGAVCSLGSLDIGVLWRCWWRRPWPAIR